MNKLLRLWSRVYVSPGGCWEFAGAPSQKYPTIKFKGRQRRASHIAWEEENGPIPAGLCVLHRCDNPRCVRPDHLFLGTHLDNARDRDAKGRGHRGPYGYPTNHRRGASHHLSRLSDQQVAEIRAEYTRGEKGYGTLAKKHGVTRNAIKSIVQGQTRKDILFCTPRQLASGEILPVVKAALSGSKELP